MSSSGNLDVPVVPREHATIQAKPVADHALQEVGLLTVPLFHTYGFFMCVRAIALGETSVYMQTFDFEGMLKALEAHCVTYMTASPPIMVALTKLAVVEKYDLSSLLMVQCGGAPLGKEAAVKFVARFPHVQLLPSPLQNCTGRGSMGRHWN
ncbi:hypothetical protein IFM89_005827 [Coptis chinensis]|uniref:AMP-dependent synthetase/ligase domain-containing protein n=1 Tax=Coptis chinensis TaxID=261450 RepID=A0A835GXM7_9MAGN|nr:hypothetical protein IFM89_005827 [Coptis chinensis]